MSIQDFVAEVNNELREEAAIEQGAIAPSYAVCYQEAICHPTQYLVIKRQEPFEFDWSLNPYDATVLNDYNLAQAYRWLVMFSEDAVYDESYSLVDFRWHCRNRWSWLLFDETVKTDRLKPILNLRPASLIDKAWAQIEDLAESLGIDEEDMVNDRRWLGWTYYPQLLFDIVEKASQNLIHRDAA